MAVEVLGDFWDFLSLHVGKSMHNSDFLKTLKIKSSDIVVLQANRIIPRKVIENIIYFVSELNKKLSKYLRCCINNKLVILNNRAMVFFSNYPHHIDSEDYFDSLTLLAKKLSLISFNAFEKILINQKITTPNKKKHIHFVMFTYLPI